MRLQGQVAQQFVDDIRARMGDAELMRKYSLSAKALVILRSQVDQVLKERLRVKPKAKLRINARELIADVRSGLDDDELMEKYNISLRQLQRVFRQMIEAGYATPMELSRRLCITRSQVTEAFDEAQAAVNELD
jgi:hypothetical protein